MGREALSPKGSRVRGWLAVGRAPLSCILSKHQLAPHFPSPGFQKLRQLALTLSWVQTLSKGGTGTSKDSGGTGTDGETHAPDGAGKAPKRCGAPP